MEYLTKNRKCSFCRTEIKCDCFYHDYVLTKFGGRGTAYLDFDACENCLKDIVKMIQNRIR